MVDTQVDVSREDGALMKFLIKRALQANAPLCKGQMCEEYKASTGSKVPERELRKRFVTFLAPKIGDIKNYDAAELAKLYFVTSTPVNEKFFQKLEEYNIVELDSERRITRLVGTRMKFEGVHTFSDKVDRYNEYKAKTGNISEHCKATKEHPPRTLSSAPNTSSRTIGKKDVATKPRDSKRNVSSAPINSQSEKDRSSKKEKHLKTQEKSHSDQTTCSSSIECLSAIVTIKSENRKDSTMSEYQISSNINSGKNSKNSVNFEIFRFLAVKANNAQQPLELSTLWSDYVVQTNSKSSPSEVASRFQRSLALKIHSLKEFDLETKVKMLFASSTPVEKKFLRELKKNAVVELDNNDRIIKFTSKKTGGLKLGADETTQTITKKKRRRRVFEESEDSDDDFFPSGFTHEKKIEGGKKKRRVVVYLSSDENEDEDKILENTKSSFQTRSLSSSSSSSSSIIRTCNSKLAAVEKDDAKIYSETGCDSGLYLIDNNKLALETDGSLETTMTTGLFTIEETPNSEPPKSVPTEDNMSSQIVPATEKHILPFFNDEFEHSNFIFPVSSPTFSNYSEVGIPSRPSSQNALCSPEMRSMPSVHSISLFDYTPGPVNHHLLYLSPFLESTAQPMFSNTDPESISLKDCLKLLKILVISLETPLLHDLSEQIKQAIEKTGDEDEKLPMSDMLSVAKAAFFGFSRKFRALSSEDEPDMIKNVKEFLKIFKCFLLGLESSSLDDLLNDVKHTVDDPASNDQIVMISDIQQAVQNILSTFSR